MKGAVLLLSALCILTINANAQRYLRIGVGYALPHAGQTIDGNGNPYKGNQRFDASGRVEMNVKTASFGAGGQLNFGLGHMLNKNFGLELSAVMTPFSKKYKLQTTSDDKTEIISETITRNAKLPVYIIPSLILQTGNQVKSYLRGGIILPVSTKIVTKITGDRSDYFSSDHLEVDEETKSRFNIGFAGAIGVKVNIKKNINFWAEAQIMSLSLFVKEDNLTRYEVNGANVLNQLQTTHIAYTNTVNTASQLPTYAQPFSSVGINAGFSFDVWDYKSSSTK